MSALLPDIDELLMKHIREAHHICRAYHTYSRDISMVTLCDNVDEAVRYANVVCMRMARLMREKEGVKE